MAPKEVFIVGATGPVGVYLCQEALKRGHTLRIYARNPSKLPADVSGNANVEITKGELTDDEALSKAIQGCDVIISALGPPLGIGIFTFKRGTFTKPLDTMIKAARASNIKQLYILGTPTAFVPGDERSAFLKLFIGFLKIFLNPVYSEIIALGQLLEDEARDLDWTMYRLGMLSNGQGSTKAAARLGEDGWVNATYRPGIATWIFDQVEKYNVDWARQKPVLYSRC